MELCATMSKRGIDERIITACQRGDRDAFRLLFDAYKDKVYSIAIYFLHGDHATAEDVTQEVFVRLFTRIGQYRGEAEFVTWLYRLVVNACMDEQRKRRRLVPFGDPEVMSDRETGESPDEIYSRLELTESVRVALADLSPPLRLTILLKYFEELSYEEMARALGCSQGTIASRLHRGLKILAHKLAHLRPASFSGE
jgi:RNA polymerase sigma-70 factor, ECF subfamily